MRMGEETLEPWTIRLLGGFEIAGPDGRVEVPPSAQHLVAYLALHHQPLPRMAAATHIWPDARPARALANLRNTLWRLGPAAPVILVTGASLTVAPDVVIDLVALERHVAESAESGVGLNALLRGFDLELLPGWDDEWVELERERVRQVELHLLGDIVTRCSSEGRHGDAVDAALRALRLDPLRETSQAALLRALLAGGDRAAALNHFRRFTQQTHHELGLPPSPQLVHLVSDLLPTRAARRTHP